MVDNTDANLGDLGQTDPNAAPPANEPEALAEGETYFDKVNSTKKYEDQEAMAKAIYHGDFHHKRLETENANMRKWAGDATPYLKLVDEYMKSDAYKAKYGEGTTVPGQAATKDGNAPKPDPKGKADSFAAAYQKDPTGITKVVEELLKPSLGQINKKMNNIELKATLNTMREDKTKYPFMTVDLENQMNSIFNNSNRSFPMTEQGLKILYDTAVGENVQAILADKESVVSEAVAASILKKKGSFAESDRDGAAGGPLDDSSALFESMKTAVSDPSMI